MSESADQPHLQRARPAVQSAADGCVVRPTVDTPLNQNRRFLVFLMACFVFTLMLQGLLGKGYTDLTLLFAGIAGIFCFAGAQCSLGPDGIRIGFSKVPYDEIELAQRSSNDSWIRLETTRGRIYRFWGPLYAAESWMLFKRALGIERELEWKKPTTDVVIN